jgi:hypothetical protein
MTQKPRRLFTDEQKAEAVEPIAGIIQSLKAFLARLKLSSSIPGFSLQELLPERRSRSGLKCSTIDNEST